MTMLDNVDTARLVRHAHDHIRDMLSGPTLPPPEAVRQTVDSLLGDLVRKKAISQGSCVVRASGHKPSTCRLKKYRAASRAVGRHSPLSRRGKMWNRVMTRHFDGVHVEVNIAPSQAAEYITLDFVRENFGSLFAVTTKDT
jgi:hypothetical protein